MTRSAPPARRTAGAIALACLAAAGCTTVRQLRPPERIADNGKAERTRTPRALDYSVATRIEAPPEAVWRLLTDAAGYLTWNSTIVSLEGPIAAGSRIKLVAKVAPKHTFGLTVSRFEPPRAMVWEDGGNLFLGVRNFALLPAAGGTTFVMSETFSGGMLGLIEGSLPDFRPDFEAFAADLKRAAERTAAR